MKKIWLGILTFVMVLSMAACGTSNGSGSGKNLNGGGDGGDKKKVVVAVKKLSSSFWVQMVEGIEDQCKEYGWEVEVLCPVNETNEEQIQLLEQSLLDPPDVYLITPIDSRGIVPTIEKINDAGIPVINFNTKIGEGAETETFVGVEYQTLAAQAAEAIAEKVDYKGNILMLDGLTGSQTTIDIAAGAEGVFGKYGDMVILDRQPANYLRTDALTVTQNLLQKYSDVQIIFAGNGEMALGAAEAVRQANRSDIMIATLNMSDEVAEAIGDGSITLTVDDDSYTVGKTAAQSAKKALDGEKLEENIYTDGITVDSGESLDPYREKYGF